MNTTKSAIVLTLSALSFIACRAHSGGSEESQALSSSGEAAAQSSDQKPSKETKETKETNGQAKHEIIRDYPVKIESITVRPYQRPPLPNGLDPVQFVIKGTIQKNGKSVYIQQTIEGLSLPMANTTAREYLPIGREGDSIYTERKKHQVAKIDNNGRVILDPNWKWETTYREYRYNLEDRVSALLFGVHVKNTEAMSIDINPQ